jgi:uncharacterized protein (DUF1778 family)
MVTRDGDSTFESAPSENALVVADDTLPDRAHFGLNAEQWEAFQLALSAPPRPWTRLAKLLREPSVFDRGSL